MSRPGDGRGPQPAPARSSAEAFAPPESVRDPSRAGPTEYGDRASGAGAAPAPHRAQPFRPWEIVPALLIGLGSLLWLVPALRDPNYLDLGLAYRGGLEAWASGRPENLRSWMSTPFLALVMAIVSRAVSVEVAMRALTAANVLLLAAIVFFTWRRLRARTSRGFFWLTLACGVSFSPAISTILLKQFNLLVLALALAGFLRVREGRQVQGGALAALSVAVKPILVLLPLALLARRDTRKAGLVCVLGIAALTATAQAFLAWRAGELAALSPLPALQNFSVKTAPWVEHQENFSPQALLWRVWQGGRFRDQRRLVLLAVGLVVLLANEAARRARGSSFEMFALAALLSPMLSPIAWSHYQLFLAPMFLLLAYRFHAAGARWPFWAMLVFAFVLAELVQRPLGDTLPGALGYLLTGASESQSAFERTLAVSQFAQYFLLLTWFSWLGSDPASGARDEPR
jgi:hypothetical protein